MARTLKERIRRFTNHSPDEIEPEEPEEFEEEEIDEEEEPELEYKVLTIETEAAAETIEEMLSDDWALDDHIAIGAQVILIFSRERD
ncbi:MAG: hypothetical protein J2P41_11825 [Blastocatellia bacterium]|nr:hypothetical protein [Blastocatellia bacterium]